MRTEIDEQGQRWIQFYDIKDIESKSLFEEISNDITDLFIKKLDKQIGKEQSLEIKMFLSNKDLGNIERKIKKIIIDIS